MKFCIINSGECVNIVFFFFFRRDNEAKGWSKKLNKIKSLAE